MSLREMTCDQVQNQCVSAEAVIRGLRTFSWRRCFRSLSSRYVLLARTGVLKGFMIFLTATFWLVSWSLAELDSSLSVSDAPYSKTRRHVPNQTKRSHAHRLEVRVSAGIDMLIFAPRRLSVCGQRGEGGGAVPGGDLERSSKDLGSYEFSHGVAVAAACDGGW